MSSDPRSPRRAGIIAVGSELLTPFRTDTNSLLLTSRLNDIGVDVVVKHIVGDRRPDLLAVLRDTLALAEIVILTGGLGPTDDDITRVVVAEAFGLPLVEDADGARADPGQVRDPRASRCPTSTGGRRSCLGGRACCRTTTARRPGW